MYWLCGVRTIIINTYCWYTNKSATHPPFLRTALIFIQEYEGCFSPSRYKQSLTSHNSLTISATCLICLCMYIPTHCTSKNYNYVYMNNDFIQPQLFRLLTQCYLNVDDILKLLKVIITTIYFSFRGTVYQQKFGTAMGSPVSPVIANLFMEWLEQQATLTAPITCKPKLWKSYVDDVMEVVRKGCEQELTEHLNNIDTTGSRRFTYEKGSDNSLPFLKTLMIRKEDGTLKLLV